MLGFKIPSILLVDDEESLQRSLCLNLEAENYLVTTTGTAESALKILEKRVFEVLICDYKLPDLDGLELIQLVKQKYPSIQIIFATGFGDRDIALKALAAGAYLYINKPFNIEELVFALKKIEEKQQLIQENQTLKLTITERYKFQNIISQNQTMKEIFDKVSRIAQFNTTILIRGESGTGKELIARAIHNSSTRKNKPFVAINCGAIPENLMESELFGHKAGSFTDAKFDKKGLFEEASGGTVFLDEIGEMPLNLQVKLLRVLQEHTIQKIGAEKPIPIDLRVIAATLRDLEEDVETGRFRDDLYYRLDVVSISIPPLRERSEDIPLLVEHFIEKHSKRLGVQVKSIEPETLKALMQYQWKGNIRELENCIERGLVLAEGDNIDLKVLPNVISLNDNSDSINIKDNLSVKDHTKTLEIKLIKKALEKTNGNRTHAAKLLELSHRALLYKLKEYDLGK